MKVYVAYCEGFMTSDWVEFAGDNLESMKRKIVKDFDSSVDEIKIFENNEEVYPAIKVHYEGYSGFSFDVLMYQKTSGQLRKEDEIENTTN